MKKLLQSLSPLEQKVVPYLNESIEEIIEKTKLDRTSVMRALQFLENKGVLTLASDTKKVVEIGANGAFYKKNHLPERRLLLALEQKNYLPLADAKKAAKLSDNEFKVSLGVLKRKALIELKEGKLVLNATKEELTKKTLEEQLLDALPKAENDLEPQEKLALQGLLKRKDIVLIDEKKVVSFKLSAIGKKIAGKKVMMDLLEEVTPAMIKGGVKNKQFRAYDLTSTAPLQHPAKRHFVNQAITYAKRIWTDLGFTEMHGSMVQSSFWNFDALFSAQDHPTRELQDTFYVKGTTAALPGEKLVTAVKKAHEEGVDESIGWQYDWNKDDARSVVLRTHTTPLSIQTLAKLDCKKDLPAKYFAIGKCFRNETVDWSHGFEFYQTEGIVVDKDATLQHLLGYLQEFYKKMGFDTIRFRPAYFPYTEPSVEVDVWHPEKKVWLELGGAGIFRPEVVVPLLGEFVPVLAWGQGFDRIIMDYYKIKDLREMYANDIKKLRTKKAWTRT